MRPSAPSALRSAGRCLATRGLLVAGVIAGVLGGDRDAGPCADEGVNADGWTARGARLGEDSTPVDLIGQLIGSEAKAPPPGSEATGLLMSRRGHDIVLGSGSVLSLVLDGDVILPEPAASRASFP